MRVNMKLLLVLLAVCALRCEGPIGPSAAESLIDPNIQPNVIYTNPPSNGLGPFLDFTGQVMIRFNKIMDKSSLRRALSITSSAGPLKIDTSNVRTVGGDVFTFTPVDTLGFALRWKVGQSCTIGISSVAKDINGNSLNPSFSMTFTPEPTVRIISVIPTDRDTNVSLTSGFRITWNSPVDLSIVPSIAIAPPPVGYWYIPAYGDSTMMYYALTKPLAFGTTYRMSVGAGATDKFGNRLPSEFVSTFKTIDFRVTSTFPAPNELVGNLGQEISVVFSGPIDTASARAAFGISPQLDGTLHLQGGVSYFEFFSTLGFLPNTTYSVTLSASMKSSTGIPLAQPYSFAFTTDSFRVLSTTPANGDTGITYPVVFVAFNSTIRMAGADSGLTISPAVHGTMSFSYESYGYYISDMQPHQRYDVTISAPTATLNGSVLLRPYHFSFTTGNL